MSVAVGGTPLVGRAELRLLAMLLAFPRGTAALHGREGAAGEEVEDAVRFLRAGGVSFAHHGSLALWALLLALLCSFAHLLTCSLVIRLLQGCV